MPDHSYVRILHRVHNAPGERRLVLLESGMDRCDHEIEFRQQLVGIIERAILTDIHFRSGEHPNVRKLGVKRPAFIRMF